MEKKKFLILDGNSILFRAFYALPPLKNKKGIYTNAVYGFLSMMYKLLDEYKPDYIVTAFDPKKPTFRHEKYKEYKAGRAKAPNELVMQFGLIRDVLELHGIKHLEIEGYEADDVAGSLSKFAAAQGIEVYMVTSDRDYLQLVDDDVYVLITKKGVTNTVKYTRELMEEEYGMTPKQFIDLKALMGDSSDNIPGVKGVGEKTGMKLIHQFETLEGIYENIGEVKGKLKEKLESEKMQAYMSRDLATIVTEIPMECSMEDFLYKEVDGDELMEMYKEFGFRQFMNRLKSEDKQLSLFSMGEGDKEEDRKPESKKVEVVEIDSKKLYGEINSASQMAIKVLYDGERALYSKPVAMGVMIDDKRVFYIEDNIEESIVSIKEILENPSVEKFSHDIKDEIILFDKLGISLEGVKFDTMIGKYLLEPSESSYSIDKLVFEYLDLDIKGEKDYLGSGKNKKVFSGIEPEDRKEFLSNQLSGVWNIKDKMEKQIMEADMDSLYNEIELPLVEIMASMEILGFKINTEELKAIGERLGRKIEILEEIIYDFADEVFNINSPKQLGEILFDKLGLPVIKKTKTGYSTNAEVLDKLKLKHPIVLKILEYRQLAKLKSTYVDGLLNVVDKETGRVHSSFKQTIASTGRISSTEPNLQNIPVKTEEGRELRKVFVHEVGRKLVDADYSQIELRVLAHLSDDENLKSAFINNEDIHRKTAAQVFHVEEDEVTSIMRSRAKAVNFGIVYGISDYGLSRDLDIPRKESKEYIENYLNFFGGVKDYMDNIVKQGKKDGYVDTIFGRRRYIPELNSRNFNIRALGERLALNTPVQGTAADIIKKAMINVYFRLKENNMKSRLILQIHDELIIEAVEEELEDVKLILKNEMEKAAELKVPLTVDMNIGDTWYDTK
ncbi:DNA polymerase I [Dethiosulfatibacter aminovorans DSM 17477]|uniref:DNA polymerase I n=1 Tax=Dethiosulfatibacter aminovorans DSM 17477 TaxID=1121476 RepID=A0A1M6FUY0_9FIRM|nr:DNA polymerase I [Dethiosulfatibacter aminovorans]SHJ01505.1 DNA polymerase I [Dethiosulfatibacter aminovorans DSM 17477]